MAKGSAGTRHNTIPVLEAVHYIKWKSGVLSLALPFGTWMPAMGLMYFILRQTDKKRFARRR